MDKRLTPDPPVGLSASRIDKRLDPAVERAFAHYGLPMSDDPLKHDSRPRLPRKPASLSVEDKLVNASSVLQSAAATAYESADQLDGSNRKLAMGTVHLIELAQSWVDSVLDEDAVVR
ncbi:DUF6124 family protein [Pseudomonas batumici]|uniref:DUF6124 family protein n=1 Tax=Pseudomonas batumici TaxID=226910 RepID=UPI000589F9B5|nr:hypothetical protein [Pseudomonas batumici]